MGARLHDHRDDDRPADPGVDVEVPDIQPPPEAETAGDERAVEDDPGEQEAS
jgi:hypothetical protein